MDLSGNPSASSSQSPPKEDTSNTHLELNAQETDRHHLDSQPPQPPPPPRYPIHNSQNTILRQTTTTRVKPPVPPAQPNPSGIVPLGPPPPRQPPPALGRFDHLPPPSLTYRDCCKILDEFIDGLESAEEGVELSELKDLVLALQMNLKLPPDAGLFEMFQSNGSMQEVIDYVMDYFQTSEVSLLDD